MDILRNICESFDRGYKQGLVDAIQTCERGDILSVESVVAHLKKIIELQEGQNK